MNFDQHNSTNESRPQCKADEFSRALLAVVGETPASTGAKRIREKAQELGRVIRSYRDGTQGRDFAAEFIWGRVNQVIASRV